MVDLNTIVPMLKSNDVIVQSYDYNRASGRFWEIKKPITVRLSNNYIINIEKGFCYDMATVPPFIWSIIKPYDDALIAYLIHDWLYINKGSHPFGRHFCDYEMLLWANETNTNRFNNYLRYFFVRLFGWLYWKRII